MADVAAPKAKAVAVKPEKPDEEQFKKDLADAKKAHEAAQKKFEAAKAKVGNAVNSKDSPVGQRRQALIKEQNEIRAKQAASKSSRAGVIEKRNKLEERLKSQQSELKTAQSRIPFKSVEEIENKVQQLRKQVDAGTMKIVDEKKALNDISTLERQKKGFGEHDRLRTAMDETRALINEEKKKLDDPEQRALSERYTEIAKELDAIRADQDSARKNRDSLFDDKNKAHAEQEEKWKAMRAINDNYFEAKRAFDNWEREARRQRNEKRKQEQEAYEAGKRREVAKARLEEASAPAYQAEINAAEQLIRFFDPSAVAAKETTGPSKFAATAQRIVDDSGIKGTRLTRKDDDEENYFVGTGGKKGKKGKKGPGVTSPAPITPSEGKFNLNIGIIEQLASIDVAPPNSQAEVPAVIDKLKSKLETWKKDQDRKTKENISKAQKEIERLEAESQPEENGAKDTANKPAAKNQAVNGKKVDAEAELAQEKDGADDAARELAKAKLEDSATA